MAFKKKYLKATFFICEQFLHHRATHARSATHSWARSTTFAIAFFVAKRTKVVDKLHRVVATNYTVVSVCRITRSYAARERSVLVKDVVDTNIELATTIAEDLLTDKGVANKVRVLVIVGDTNILFVGRSTCEGEVERQNELHACRCCLAKVCIGVVGRRS